MATSTEKRTKRKAERSYRRKKSSGSFLLSRISRLSARCTWSFRRGFLSRLFCRGDKAEQCLRTGLAATALEHIGYRDLISKPVKKAVAAGSWESVLFARADGLRRAFLHTKARFFGIALMVFAVYAAGIYFAKELMDIGVSGNSPWDLVTAGVLLPISLFLIFCGKPMSSFLGDSHIVSHLLVDILGMDPAAFRGGDDKVTARGGIAFITGAAAGLATFFVSPWQVLLLAASLMFLLCIPAVPEMGLLLAVVLLPLTPLRYTAFFTALAAFGYLLKFFRLKRTFRFGVPEVMMLLTVAAFGLSAMSTGNYFWFGRMLLFGCIWFLTVNLITTERLLRKYMSAIVYGGIITLTLVLIGKLSAVMEFPAVLQGIRLPGFLMSGETLKCYMLMLTPFALMHGGRRCGFVLLLLLCGNVYLMGSMWMAAGLLLGVLLYAALGHGAWVGSGIFGAAACAAALPLVGDKLGNLGDGFSASAQELICRFPWTGVGAGDGAVLTAALAEGLRPDGFASNLYMRLLLDGGIILLVLFVCCIFFSWQRLFTCLREYVNGEEKRRTILCGTVIASSILFLLSAGVTPLGEDLRVLGLFFCLCPLASLTGTLYGFDRKKEVLQQWI